jgi:DNA-binding response OmpR family regulator
VSRVLLVEDDVDISQIAKTVLEQAGHEVTTAFDSASAAALLLGKQRWDAIVADVMIPGPFDGVELVRAARRLIAPSPGVVFVTGLGGTPGLNAVAAELGCKVIQKPCSMSVILGAVEKILEGP